MYLSSDLVTSVKARASVPTAQITFQNTDFYRFADEEIRSNLIPLILKNLEEFYVAKLDYAVVPGQASYIIPSRAIAGKLRDVELVSTTDDTQRVPLERLNREDLSASVNGGSTRAMVKKSGFYLEGNRVVVYPTPTSGQNFFLRLSYYMRPNQLVDVLSCAQVTAIDTVNSQVTVASLPSAISTATPVDFVKANPGFECSAIDQTITNVASNVLTFSSLPSDLFVGDYICLAGQSCVVQVPVELQPLLYQYVVVRILAAQTDSEAYKIAISELKRLEDNAGLLISPRVDGKAKRVTNGRPISRFV